MLSSAPQPLNAADPIEVTLSGITISVNAEQPENAELPMVVTFSPRATLVKPVHPLNAESGIDSEFITTLKFVQSKNAPFSIPVIFPLILSDKSLQPENAYLPMLFIFSPRVTLVKPVHPLNAQYKLLSPVTVTLLRDEGM